MKTQECAGIGWPCLICGAKKGELHIRGCLNAAVLSLKTTDGEFKGSKVSENNGVIRVGRKGLKKFAFGADGAVFQVDVVVAFQHWIGIDDQFRERTEDRSILTADMPDYHRAAVMFVMGLATGTVTEEVTTAEALDFIARLREQYDEVAAFFQPKLRGEPDSPDTSAAELRFSAEAP